MYRHPKKTFVRCLVLLLAGLMVLPCMPAFAQGGGGESSHAIVGPKAENVPDEIRRWLTGYRRRLPEELKDTRLRVEWQSVLQMGVGMRDMVMSVCPVDKDDKRHGTEEHYVPFRPKQRETNWKHGVQHGLELHYGPERNVEKEIPFVDGKIHGDRKVYFISGELMAVTPYVEGQEQGESTSYDEEGRVTRKVTYIDGQKHGEMTDYWPETGKLKRVVPYDKGIINGVAIDYYSDGSKKRERPFKNNQLHGIEKQYDTKGEVVSTRYWIENKPVNRVKYEAMAGE